MNSTCLIIDNSQKSKNPTFSIRSKYIHLDIPLVTDYVKNVVNCVHRKFFEASPSAQLSFIRIIVNDKFPQYDFQVINNHSSTILQTLVNERSIFQNHPALAKCTKCNEIVLEPFFWSNNLYHQECANTLAASERSILSYLISNESTPIQSIGDKLLQISYINNLSKITHPITICVQISLNRL